MIETLIHGGRGIGDGGHLGGSAEHQQVLQAQQPVPRARGRDQNRQGAAFSLVLPMEAGLQLVFRFFSVCFPLMGRMGCCIR